MNIIPLHIRRIYQKYKNVLKSKEKKQTHEKDAKYTKKNTYILRK